jgi:NADPH:quinone reductase-like Zn-dependent oxidoreductase
MATKGFRYARLGPLASVVNLESFTPAASEVTVSVKKAPLHRADAAVINGTISGGHGKSPFPRIAGTEAFGTVAKSNAPAFKVGQTVWVAPPHGGWAESLSVPASALCTVDAKHAALAPFIGTLIVANRLVKGNRIPKGGVIVQNGGSSAVSLAVSALGKANGYKVITAAAPGPRFAAAAARHKAFDSEVVEYNGKGRRKATELLKGSSAHLYLNGVGGPNFSEFIKLLGPDATAVTYGAQYGFGLMFSGGALIFKNTTLTGFSFPRYWGKLNAEQRQAEVDDVLTTFSKLKFEYPTKETKLDQLPGTWDDIFVNAGVKGVLTF